MHTVPTPDVRQEADNSLVINYLTLRKALGWMGLLLPLALITGSFIWNDGHLESSISNYFYTVLRDVFVVTLCAMALFLFTYRGYDRKDRWVTNAAGTLGLITAFVSTNFKHTIHLPPYELVTKSDYTVVPLDTLPGEALKIIPVPHAEFLGYLHLGCAALFFLALAYMAYFQFTKSKGPLTPQKRKRNALYRACGILMAVCILALVPCFVSDDLKAVYDNHQLIFWGESVCLWAFGTSWLVKGEFLLADGD